MGCSINFSFLLILVLIVVEGNSEYHGRQNHKLPEDHWSLSPAYRLPQSVLPTHYELKIIPILETEIPGHAPFTAPGSVRIDVNCYASRHNITLHASNLLNISEGSVRVTSTSTNISVPIIGYEYNSTLDFFVIHLGESLLVNQSYQIYIEFIAPVSRDILNGLYLSTYLKPETNEVSYVAATQFQMFAFRQMAPGFDEPNIKSTFDIMIGYLPTKYKTLCNTDVDSTAPIEMAGFEGWLWDIYSRTVVMPPYLLALIVSDFDYAEAQPGLFRKPVRVYGVPHQIANGDGQYAAETSAKQLAFYEEFYETTYDMPKMDSVAVPDFLYGAMENWGLNTYRPSVLLYTANVTTEQERGTISHTLAHELGHQWFGNLVTCAWWNDIWLNEGLTTYASVYAWQVTQPEFEPLKYFHVNVFQNSLLTEELGTSAGKEFQNNGSEKIIDNFNDVNARKGAALIKMMDGFLTPETVRKGIVNYLHALSYQGAEQDDLWSYLNERAVLDGTLPEGLTVKEIMDTWTLNRGFPLLYVYNTPGDENVFIHQQQYRANGSQQEDSTGWYIPVSIATQSVPNFDPVKPLLWMTPNQTDASFSIPNISQWLIVNPSAKSYYRVIYNDHFTQLIWNVLGNGHNVISPQSRSQLIDDYFMVAFQNSTDYANIESALGFTKYLGKESDRIVWEALILNLRSTFYQVMGTPTFAQFQKYFLPRLTSALGIIGFRQESYHKGANVILRSFLLDWTCKMNSDECNDYTRELVDEWKTNPNNNPIPVDIQASIYCNAVENGGASDFDFIFGRYEVGTSIQKGRLISALACSKNISALQGLLDESISEGSRFDEMDKITIIQRVATNPLGRSLTLSFLSNNLTAILGNLTTSGVSRIVNTLTLNMATPQELTLVENFINDNESLLDSIVGTLRGYLPNIQKNINWRAFYETRLYNWFSENA